MYTEKMWYGNVVYELSYCNSGDSFCCVCYTGANTSVTGVLLHETVMKPIKFKILSSPPAFSAFPKSEILFCTVD